MNWLKYLFARKEMEMLWRYQNSVHLADRWLASHPDVVEVLAWLDKRVHDKSHEPILDLRDRIKGMK